MVTMEIVCQVCTVHVELQTRKSQHAYNMRAQSHMQVNLTELAKPKFGLSMWLPSSKSLPDGYVAELRERLQVED